jgi:hypothetical protein
VFKYSLQIGVLAIGLGAVGCPTILSRSSDKETETRERIAIEDNSGGGAGKAEGAGGDAGGLVGVSGSEAVDFSQLDEPLLPAPSEETLCMIRVGFTTLEDTKKILGKPRTESQSTQGATMSYLHTEGRSLFLTFVNVPREISGDGTLSAFEYVFGQAEVVRMTYPRCWLTIGGVDAGTPADAALDAM